MNKLRNKIKKVLNKDVTSFLNKYKIPLISILVVVLLACIGLIVTYAFYQVVDTKPVIGGSTTNIADIDVRVMAEERDSNGNGLNSYGIYPYIPRAGYKYNDTKSYCTNNSAINFNTNTYEANITAYEHDVCYLYFDSIASLDITLNVYAENVDSDGIGNGEYTKLETTALPSVGYEMNSSRSSCENGSTITYDSKENLFSVESSQKDVCNVYMDALDVDIALKIYVQTKKNSTNYYEAKKIPTNNFYTLNSKSACTGSSTMSVKNQKVVISATSKTSCVAYLDVGTGPILESMKNIVSGQSVTITVENSSIGTIPKTYYYSSDNGKTYVSSTSSSYTFSSLEPLTEYTFKSYYEDASGNTSAIFTTTTKTDYVYKGLFPFSSAVQIKNIIVSGYYKLEVWGAEGGHGYNNATTFAAGKGGYSYGTVYLNAGDTIYVYTGGQGNIGGTTTGIKAGGFNGGGASGNNRGGSGGGGTDIRINNDDTLARVIVAGGGGGGAYYSAYYGGAGGGATGVDGKGYNTTNNSKGGTQTAGGAAGYYGTIKGTAGAFYQGGNANTSTNTYNRSGGGGGGWYGGGGGAYRNNSSIYYQGVSGGGGGSGFVYTNSSVLPIGYLLGENYQLTNAQTIAGTESFTDPSGVAETGHSGNGYAKVTYIGQSL